MLRVWNHPYILHAIELQREAQAKAEVQSQVDSRPLSSTAERSARTPASIGSGAAARDAATGELLHPLMPDGTPSAAAVTPFSGVKHPTEDKEGFAVDQGDAGGAGEGSTRSLLPTPVGSEPMPIEEEEVIAIEDEDQEMELLNGGEGGVDEELEEAQVEAPGLAPSCPATALFADLVLPVVFPGSRSALGS